MKNCGLGPLRPSILDPIYVIYAFGSMLSCFLCEIQKFSESHKLKRFGTLWTSNGKKGSVKWRCEHAQSRGFLGNFVNLHNATS